VNYSRKLLLKLLARTLFFRCEQAQKVFLFACGESSEVQIIQTKKIPTLSKKTSKSPKGKDTIPSSSTMSIQHGSNNVIATPRVILPPAAAAPVQPQQQQKAALDPNIVPALKALLQELPFKVLLSDAKKSNANQPYADRFILCIPYSNRYLLCTLTLCLN